jgi:hypothetical protein
MEKGRMSLITALVFTAVIFCPGYVTGAMNDVKLYAGNDMVEPEKKIADDTDEPVKDSNEEEMEDKDSNDEKIKKHYEEIIDDTDVPRKRNKGEDPKDPPDKGEPTDPDADKA